MKTELKDKILINQTRNFWLSNKRGESFGINLLIMEITLINLSLRAQ